MGAFGAIWVDFCAILGNLGTTLGGLGRYLGTPWGLGFRVWGLGTSTHTPLKCPNRSRLTPVQRKRPHEKRRCDQALKSHTLRSCKNRSRLTLVQRKRSHDKKRMRSSIEIAHLVKMQKNLYVKYQLSFRNHVNPLLDPTYRLINSN